MRRSIFVVAVVALAVAGVVSAQTMAPASSGVVPVVSRTPGAMGSTWSTNVYLTQVAGSAPATVTMTVHHNASVSSDVVVTVPGAGGSAEVLDIVTAAGMGDGNYVMSWWSTQPVMLSTRTFTTEDSGSYGQGIGSVPVGSGFATGGTVIFPAPMDAGSHRVNVGIANAGPSTQTFIVLALDSSGAVVSSWGEDPRLVAGLSSPAIGSVQPPRNSVTNMAEPAVSAAYSAIKKSANFIELYSTL